MAANLNNYSYWVYQLKYSSELSCKLVFYSSCFLAVFLVCVFGRKRKGRYVCLLGLSDSGKTLLFMRVLLAIFLTLPSFLSLWSRILILFFGSELQHSCSKCSQVYIALFPGLHYVWSLISQTMQVWWDIASFQAQRGLGMRLGGKAWELWSAVLMLLCKMFRIRKGLLSA